MSIMPDQATLDQYRATAQRMQPFWDNMASQYQTAKSQLDPSAGEFPTAPAGPVSAPNFSGVDFSRFGRALGGTVGGFGATGGWGGASAGAAPAQPGADQSQAKNWPAFNRPVNTWASPRQASGNWMPEPSATDVQSAQGIVADPNAPNANAQGLNRLNQGGGGYIPNRQPMQGWQGGGYGMQIQPQFAQRPMQPWGAGDARGGWGRMAGSGVGRYRPVPARPPNEPASHGYDLPSPASHGNPSPWKGGYPPGAYPGGQGNWGSMNQQGGGSAYGASPAPQQPTGSGQQENFNRLSSLNQGGGGSGSYQMNRQYAQPQRQPQSPQGMGQI